MSSIKRNLYGSVKLSRGQHHAKFEEYHLHKGFQTAEHQISTNYQTVYKLYSAQNNRIVAAIVPHKVKHNNKAKAYITNKTFPPQKKKKKKK